MFDRQLHDVFAFILSEALAPTTFCCWTAGGHENRMQRHTANHVTVWQNATLVTPSPRRRWNTSRRRRRGGGDELLPTVAQMTIIITMTRVNTLTRQKTLSAGRQVLATVAPSAVAATGEVVNRNPTECDAPSGVIKLCTNHSWFRRANCHTVHLI